MINDKARFWTSKKDNTPYFCILNNFLDGYRATDKEVARRRVLGLNDFFELYDDDDNKYYSGYANFENMYDREYDEFTILDMATADRGCTYMKTRDKNGKMTMV